MNKQELLEKNNENEKILLAKIIDKIELVKRKNKIESTDFLDQHEQAIVLKLLQKIKEKNYVFYGGTKSAERKILIVYPEKLAEVFKNGVTKEDEYLTLIRITLPVQLHSRYAHRDYLGGFIKTGIKREKIGDIIVYNEGADILVIPEMAKYLQYNLPELTRFSKSKISVEKIEMVKEKEERFEENEIIVSSMRLDSIISELIKVSRNKGTEIIKQERVFVNFVVEPRMSKEVHIGDVITIRGKGRFKLLKIKRKTRNGKIVINTQKYV